MRIEFVNTVTGEAGATDLPSMLNPVRVGHHPANHLVLASPYVGAEAVAFDNDVAGGDGWRCWNRNGKPVRVADAVLADRNSYVRLTQPRVVVECWPFVLTVSLAAEEWAEPADGTDRLGRGCAALVRGVHRDLLALHAGDPADPAAWQTDAYLHDLERQIVELAGQDARFPADDLTVTDLGTHLAGVAVRSALVHRVTARHADAGDAPGPATGWSRPRLAVPELEAELARLTDAADHALGLAGIPDLTDQVGRIDAAFWPLALGGPVLTVRRFPRTRPTIADLVARFGSLSPAARNFLEAAVVNRRNVVVSGGTGTGKTTLLNALRRGGKLANVLDRIAASAETVARIAAKRETDTAAGRLMVALMAAFPVVSLAVVYTADPQMVTTFQWSAVGQYVLAGVAVAVYASVRWASWILNRVETPG